MEINLVTVSKLSSEIIFEDVIKIEHLDFPELSDLMNNIYDKYPALWVSEKYSLYWQYDYGYFLPIKDYLTYLTALRLMNEKTIYLLVDDIYEYWDDNYSYLQKLDCVDQATQKERERNIYDVELYLSPEDIERICMHPSDVSSSSSTQFYPVREDVEVLAYAVRHQPKADCYTTDMVHLMNFVKGLKQGSHILNNYLIIHFIDYLQILIISQVFQK